MVDSTTWQLLFVDDDEETCRQVREFLDDETVSATDDHLRTETLTDFADALGQLEARRFDLVILDVRLGPHDDATEEEAGVTTLEAIRQRRFVPVIFYTGLPHLVLHLQTPLIRVVEKTEGLPRLLEAVRDIVGTRLPSVNRALIRHLEAVQRRYMWDFVAAHWADFGDAPDRTALAYLLARRLAISFSGPGIQELAQDLGDPAGPAEIEGRVHPMQCYLLPPIELSPLAGDLYKRQIGEMSEHWVLLTPSCDLVAGSEKADLVLLGRTLPLTEQPEYQTWEAALPEPSNTIQGKLRDLMKNNRRDGQSERFHFLPGALTLPDLVVDFQQLEMLPRNQLNTFERIASLDSPYREELLSRFLRYFGRLGTPDLALDVILARLQEGHPAQQQ